ncbi:MAG: hypothetical protein R3330_03090 [Saprospiraceae bacterium]|nr:hypothetical protein [Saprospiraceae bacterium]
MLVLADAADAPAHLTLLKKILRAIGHDFDQDIWFATLESSESYRLLSSDVLQSVRTVLMFGIPPGNVGIRVHGAQRILQYDGFRVIMAPALSVLAEDGNQKRALWNLLQEVFQV